MRVLVWCDIEGVSGICDPDNGFKDDRYKHLATAEINAAIKGFKKGGVTKVDIFDGHGMGGNLIVEELDEIVTYLGGGWMVTLSDLIRSEKLKEYNALVLMGTHPQAGAKDGFIAHTNSSYSALRLNDKPIGEIGQAVWLAGYFGVPTILVSGDEIAVKETNHYFPSIATISVKKKVKDGYDCLPVETVYKELEEKALAGIQNLGKQELYTLEGPIIVEIMYSLAKLADDMIILPRYAKKDERTVIYNAEDYLEAFWAYHGFRLIINGLTKDFFSNVIKRLEKEFELLENEDYRKWRKEVVADMFGNSLSFPEVKF